MTTITGNQIDDFQLLTLRQMLKLEIRGMSRSRSPSAYSILKKMGYTGTRESVLAQLDDRRREILGLA
tara:strand:- start:1115 stop:1318 length:204 start_codon:yes stop_codon:yes gene_type:complete